MPNTQCDVINLLVSTIQNLKILSLLQNKTKKNSNETEKLKLKIFFTFCNYQNYQIIFLLID